MNPALRTLALVGLLVAPTALAQESNQGLRLVGADAGALDTGSLIPDIQTHRIRPLDYVRRMEDVVKLDVSGIDVEADPIITIGGEPISKAEFRRRAIMYLGVSEIDRYVVSTITLDERNRLVAAGADPARYDVDDDVVAQKMSEYIDMLRANVEQQVAQTGEDLTPEELEARKQESVDNYLESIEASSGGMNYFQQLLSVEAAFEKVFMPSADAFDGELGTAVDINAALANEPVRPSWFPEATWNALDTNDQAKNLRYFLMNAVIDGTQVPTFFRANIVQQIKDGLIADVGMQFFFDDTTLPDDVIFRIGDRLVKADELWPQIGPMLTTVDTELILRELIKLRAMRRELEAAGFWETDEEFAATFAAHNAEYEGTLFPLKNLIIFRGYSWLERYREHYRYRQAYGAMVEGDLSDEEVLAHYQTGGRLFFERGLATVDAAYQYVGDTFSQPAFDAAQAGLEDAFIDLAGDFGALKEAKPLPIVQKQRGDDRTFQRAPLRLRLCESELSIFLTGYSLADDVFYHGVPGEVFGPWQQRCRRHAWGGELNAGVWLVRVDDYRRGQALPPFDDRNRELAFEDYVDLLYNDWSEDLLAATLPTITFGG